MDARAVSIDMSRVYSIATHPTTRTPVPVYVVTHQQQAVEGMSINVHTTKASLAEGGMDIQ